MQPLKKIGLVIAVALFSPLFLLAVSSYAFNNTVGDKTYVKSTLKQANVYNTASETLVDSALGAGKPDPLIKSALQESTGPKAIEKIFNPALDSTYSWLNGEIKSPNYSLKLKQIRTTFEKSLTKKLKTRAAKLPTCTYARQTNTNDLFSAKCIPPGTDVNGAINDAVARVTANADIFSDKSVADGSVNASEAKELGIALPSENPAPVIASSYQFFAKGYPLFVIMSAASAIAIILLSSKPLGGVRKLAVLLLVNGLVLFGMSTVLQFLLSGVVPTTSESSTQAPIDALQEAARIIIADNAQILRSISLRFGIAGLLGTIAVTVYNKKEEELSHIFFRGKH